MSASVCLFLTIASPFPVAPAPFSYVLVLSITIRGSPFSLPFTCFQPAGDGIPDLGWTIHLEKKARKPTPPLAGDSRSRIRGGQSLLNLDPQEYHFQFPIPNPRREGEAGDEETEVAGFRLSQLQSRKRPFFSSSPLAAGALPCEYAILPGQEPSPPLLRPQRPGGMRGGGGEIVEVQGGHIVRSTGRKDRHSKVCTSKGPRDRRVRLSAHTAIQFYDVQDRLGYDRPSKAVDWLIKNAKSAIDELAELPAWQPTAIPASSSGKRPMQSAEPVSSSAFSFATTSSFIPPSLDSDAIADTIKSFFPVTVAATSSTSSSPTSFHDYSPELLPHASNQSQDLRLSLQSFQDPTFNQPSSVQNHSRPTQFSFHAASAGFSPPEQRMATWNSLADGCGGYVFNLPPSVMLHPMVFGQGQLSSQRGPLQSSNSPLVRPWTDPTDHQLQQALKPPSSSIGFASGDGSFPSFRIPARIQGEEEPSSGFSPSHHQCTR